LFLFIYFSSYLFLEKFVELNAYITVLEMTTGQIGHI